MLVITWYVVLAMEFKVKYDRVADAVYIRFRDDRVVDTDEIAPGVIVDYNNNGEIVGIEILWFSKRKLDLAKLVTEGPEVLVAEA